MIKQQTIVELVARAISAGVHPWTIRSGGKYQRTYCPFCQVQTVEPKDHRKTCEEFLSLTRAAITAFLDAAAKQGWNMRPDEADGHMCNHGAVIWREGGGASINQRCGVIYTVMTEAAPKFEWDI